MSGAQIIKTPNSLRKAKIGTGPGKLDTVLLDRAEKAVQKLGISYGEWVKDDLKEIEATMKTLVASGGKDEAAMKELYRVVFDTKGQGGSFGYPLLTQVAGSLAEFLCERKELDRFALEVAAAHVSAMRAVIRENVRDDGGQTGTELAEGLHVLVAKARSAEAAEE